MKRAPRPRTFAGNLDTFAGVIASQAWALALATAVASQAITFP